MPWQNTYIAIDLKSFYASVECMERGLNPLTTNLVVADRSRTEKTICLAVSPSLKAYGIGGRCRLFEVEQRLKEIKAATGEEVSYITAPPRMQHYINCSAEIYSIYLKYIAPEDIHVYSIDEVFMDVTNYLSLYRMSAHDLARMIIQDVLSHTGITATAGIGSNLYLAKVAMDIVAKRVKADADGVRIAQLDEMEYRRLLWDHRPLTDFWRVGKGIAARLERNHINTMGDLAQTSLYNEDWLYRQFGIDAELLIDHAWGWEPCRISDIKSYRPQSSSIGAGQVLHCPYPFEKARLIVREMTDDLILDLADQGLMTGGIVLDVGYDRDNVDRGSYKGAIHVDRYGRSVPKPAHGTANLGAPTSSTKKIMDAALELFDRIADKNLLVRRITITAIGLTDSACEQFDLFTDPVQLEKERKMQQAMLSIKKRFGKNAILKGTSLEEGATARDRNHQIGGHNA